MNQFIKLPSGIRINTRYIAFYEENPCSDTGAPTVRIKLHPDDGIEWNEDLTLEQMDALLSPPAVTPLLQKLGWPEVGQAVEFTFEGKTKMGVIASIDRYAPPRFYIDCDGERYAYTPNFNETQKIS